LAAALCRLRHAIGRSMGNPVRDIVGPAGDIPGFPGGPVETGRPLAIGRLIDYMAIGCAVPAALATSPSLAS